MPMVGTRIAGPSVQAGTFRGSYTDWLAAYRFAIINAAIFLVFSLTNGLISSVYDSIIPAHFAASIIFAIGSALAFFHLCKAGGALAAVSFYVLGTGIFFGLGTALSIIANDNVYQLLFSEADQIRNLPFINIMNSLSCCIVLLTAWPIAKQTDLRQTRRRLGDTFAMLDVLWLPSVIASVLFLLIAVRYFPIPEDLILRNLLSKLRFPSLLCIFLSFLMWGRLAMFGKTIAVGIVAAMVIYGIAAASKLEALLPILSLIAGAWLGQRRRIAAVLGLLTVAWYFAFLAPTVIQMRANPEYDADRNSVSERLNIFWDVTANSGSYSPTATERGPFKLFLRFAHSPFQSYLIDQWEQGRPGTSMGDSWAALIPRILWPDKPIVTRYGGELYEAIFETEADSALAPTYTGEAFWNYGWIGVVLVSILLGLEFGWLTRAWLRIIYGNNFGLGIVIFCIPVIVTAGNVESWIGASYIGGFVTLAILIKAADFILKLGTAKSISYYKT